jgi:hypothetical protein
MTIDFSDHTPGQAYTLTREQFVGFLGQAEIYQAFKSLRPGYREEACAFWATLALFEAARTFNPYSQFCPSHLKMAISGGRMEWEYVTTSGTGFKAIEWREFETIPAPGYPGSACSDELPTPVFTVKTPADRDQPGRYHYGQLRSGGCYCG